MACCIWKAQCERVFAAKVPELSTIIHNVEALLQLSSLPSSPAAQNSSIAQLTCHKSGANDNPKRAAPEGETAAAQIASSNNNRLNHAAASRAGNCSLAGAAVAAAVLGLHSSRGCLDVATGSLGCNAALLEI